MSQNEFSWKSADGLAFYGREWRPDGQPRAVVVLVHGLGEHCGRYAHVAEVFNAAGLGVVALDHRGHGKTEGTRGHGSYDGMGNDIAHLLEEAANRYPGLPCFLYGHSLGGALVLYYTLTRKQVLAGVIATAPGLIPANPPAGAMMLAAKIASVVAPAMQIDNNLDRTGLARDPEVEKKYSADPLVHGKISAKLGMDLINKGAWMIAHAAEFPLPLLLLQGTADRLVSPTGAAAFADAAPKDKLTYKTYEGYYHELHNEPEKVEVLADILDWINEQLG